MEGRGRLARVVFPGTKADAWGISRRSADVPALTARSKRITAGVCTTEIMTVVTTAPTGRSATFRAQEIPLGRTDPARTRFSDSWALGARNFPLLRSSTVRLGAHVDRCIEAKRRRRGSSAQLYCLFKLCGSSNLNYGVTSRPLRE